MSTKLLKKKSGSLIEEVPADTLKAFRALVKSYPSISAFLRESGMNRPTTKRLMKEKYCHPYTLQTIQSLVNPQKVA